MDSPEGDRILISASAATSPPVQESPFFSFARRLPPINLVKPAQHITRFPEIIFPSTPRVFKSPQPDPLHKKSFLKRDAGLCSPSDGKNALTFHVYEQGDSELQFRLIACSEKEILSGVPSGCVDEYLTDPSDAGTTDSAEGYVQSNDDASQLLERGFPGSDSSTTFFNDSSDEVQAKIFPDLSEKLVPSRSSFIQKFGETCNEYMDFLSKYDEDHTESDMILKHLEGQNVKVQNAGGQHNEYGENRLRMSCTVSCRPVPDGFSKFARTQHGIRRHLQFEGGRDPGRSASHRKINSSNIVLPLPFTSLQAIRTTDLQTPFFQYVQDKSAPIPSGIGELMPRRGNNISEDLSVIDADNYDHNNYQAFAVSTGVVDAGNHDQISSFNSFPLPCFDQPDPPCKGTMTDPQNAERFEELHHNSPKRNRKKTRSTSKTGGSRTCNCKRSKCLKLYCECFSAGVFCGDSCACDNCFNKPENDDAIAQKRKDIKLRCPEAFSPKVVKNTADSPAHALEDGHGTTPSSARHKRGCNCKKSKCSKRYCECFQANVGCSDGCRCENCENSFGKKRELMFYKTGRWNKLSSEKLDSSDGIRTEILTDISNIITPLPNSQSQALGFSTCARNSSLQWKDEVGRKFVLQTVPSFPPLTPYSNTKDRTYQSNDDLRDQRFGYGIARELV